MGKLIDGVWHDVWYDTKSTGGRFEREDSSFRNWITADGTAGPTGDSGFRAEPGRYHLYVSYACPWAHRTLIFRALKGLEDMISVSVVNPYMGAEGWTFEPGPKVVGDPVHGAKRLHQVYTSADPAYTGRVIVPALWDREQGTIVSNESADIIRMFNSAFDGVGAKAGDFHPDNLCGEIDAINKRVYDTVNNGVYRAGFATSQAAYGEAVAGVFETLDWLEQRLASRRYLTGNRITEADWRLFTTLVRFDEVYHTHFKCNQRRITDYHNLWSYTRDLYQMPGVANTVHMDHIKAHYYKSHHTINPPGVVPVGPGPDFAAPHDRARYAKAG
ncbi:MAG: glutathione S-transferase family protein [Sphingomonadales bacterium]